MLSQLTFLLLATATAGDLEPALKGLDPVLLCEGQEAAGDPALVVKHGRYAYRFLNEGNRARFLNAPERWGIQWGGGCGRMGPLSGVGSPDRWTVYRERIFLFASDGCREGFLSAPEKFVVPTADRMAQPAIGAAELEAGSDWIERAVQAHGGASRLARSPGVRYRAQRAQGDWIHTLEEIVARSGELMRRSIWRGPDEAGFDTRWVLAKESFVDEDGQIFALTSPDQLADLRRFVHREPLYLLSAHGEPGYLAWDAGSGTLAEEPVQNVRVRFANLETTLHLQPEDGTVRGLSWRGRPADGVTREVTEIFTDYATVDELLIPTARQASADGKANRSLSIEWETVEPLTTLPPEAFRRSD